MDFNDLGSKFEVSIIFRITLLLWLYNILLVILEWVLTFYERVLLITNDFHQISKSLNRVANGPLRHLTQLQISDVRSRGLRVELKYLLLITKV